MIDGPKMDWTRDNKMYERYLQWKKRCDMIFKSALKPHDESIKCEYLKYWLGTEGLPLIEKWENTGKLVYEADTAELRTGHKIETYWTLLEAELQPKANKIISIIELWNKSKQNSTTLNEWITKVYNMVDLCDYVTDKETIKDRIIRDVLIVGCTSTSAKDKIIRKGSRATLQEVIEILQMEESTSKTLSSIGSDSKSMHYARYDKKKSGSKGGKPKTSQSSSSRNSQSSQGADRPTCYRCRKPWFKGHMKSCPAINVKCHKCGITGHYDICCKKTGNFPKKATSTFKKQHIAASHNPEDLYYDEDGHRTSEIFSPHVVHN